MSTENNETENTTNTPIQAGALTQILSQYRTDARLGHEQVSEALCLPVSSVKALENEEFDKLPEPPYVRGYLRTYSRLANKDPSEVIKIYNALHGGSPSTAAYNYSLSKGIGAGTTKQPFFSEAGVRLGVFALLLSVLGLLTMQPSIKQWMQETWDNFSAEETSSQSNGLPGESLIDANALAGDILGNLPVSDTLVETVNTVNTEESTSTTNTENNQDKNTENNTEETGSTSSKQEENTDKTDDTTLTPQETNTTESNEASSQADNTTTKEGSDSLEEGKIKIKLVFSGEVWLRIKNNNKKTVYVGLNQANSEKELILTPPLKFKVGSADGLKIYINGKEKDITEYTSANVARFNIE